MGASIGVITRYYSEPSMIKTKMRAFLSGVALLAALADAQQLYFTTDGYTERPQCTQAAATPQYYFRPFSYTLNETVR